MDNALIEKIVRMLRQQQADIATLTKRVESLEYELAAETLRAEMAEQDLKACNAQARTLADALNSCRTNLQAARRSNRELTAANEDLTTALRACESSKPEPVPQPTVVNNDSSTTVRVDIAGDTYTLNAGQSVTVGDAGGEVTVKG